MLAFASGRFGCKIDVCIVHACIMLICLTNARKKHFWWNLLALGREMSDIVGMKKKKAVRKKKVSYRNFRIAARLDDGAARRFHLLQERMPGERLSLTGMLEYCVNFTADAFLPEKTEKTKKAENGKAAVKH